MCFGNMRTKLVYVYRKSLQSVFHMNPIGKMKALETTMEISCALSSALQRAQSHLPVTLYFPCKATCTFELRLKQNSAETAGLLF